MCRRFESFQARFSLTTTKRCLIAQIGLYLFEAAAFGLSHHGADEDEGEDSDHDVSEECDAWSDRGEKERKSLGDDEVGDPVQEDGDSHRGTPYPQRQDLRELDPDGRSPGGREGDDETRQTYERYDSDEVGRARRLGEYQCRESQDGQAYHHPHETCQEQQFAPDAVD